MPADNQGSHSPRLLIQPSKTEVWYKQQRFAVADQVWLRLELQIQ